MSESNNDVSGCRVAADALSVASFLEIFAIREYRNCVILLKPQDLLVALKLLSSQEKSWTYAHLASLVYLSQSEAHASVQRLLSAKLITLGLLRVQRKNLLELLIHGVKYVFIPKQGGVTRGLPTSYAAPPLKELILDSGDLPPVWPHPEGTTRGEMLEPLYPSVVHVSLQDPKLYEYFALIDAIRVGRVRERALATELLTERILL